MVEAPQLTEHLSHALYVWRLLGGKLDWHNMPVVFDIYDIAPDHELVWRLQLIASEVHA